MGVGRGSHTPSSLPPPSCQPSRSISRVVHAAGISKGLPQPGAQLLSGRQPWGAGIRGHHATRPLLSQGPRRAQCPLFPCSSTSQRRKMKTRLSLRKTPATASFPLWQKRLFSSSSWKNRSSFQMSNVPAEDKLPFNHRTCRNVRLFRFFSVSLELVRGVAERPRRLCVFRTSTVTGSQGTRSRSCRGAAAGPPSRAGGSPARPCRGLAPALAPGVSHRHGDLAEAPGLGTGPRGLATLHLSPGPRSRACVCLCVCVVLCRCGGLGTRLLLDSEGRKAKAETQPQPPVPQLGSRAELWTVGV